MNHLNYTVLQILAPVKKLQKIFTLVVFVFITLNSMAIGYSATLLPSNQDSAISIKIASEQLTKDLIVLKESLEEAHQGLYTYHTSPEIDKLFADAINVVKTPMSRVAFYNIISKLTASVKDGHTGVGMPVLAPTVKNQLPVGFMAIGNKLYIARSYTETYKTFTGKQVVSINGLSVKDILRYAMQHFSSDGDNTTHKLYRLQSAPRFSDMLTAITGIPAEQFSLSFSDKSDPLIINGITKAELNNLLSKEGNQLPAEFKLLPDVSAAVLTIRTFSARTLGASGINFKEFIQNSFNSIAENKINNLVIDLRGNGGGEDAYGRLLFSYFIDKDFSYYRSLTLANKKYKLFDYTAGGQRGMPEDFAVKNEAGSFSINRKYNSNVGPHQPLQPRFAGSVYILIDGGCFSTTSEFLTQMHANTKALFIGEESGGNYYTNNSGISAEIILPNSKLKVTIPMMKYVMDVPATYSYKNNGIIPQHRVSPSIVDVITKRDVVMELALQLMRKNP
jgi:hypothetical protein